MVRIDEFRNLAVGDVFYRGSTRYEIESIIHKEDTVQSFYWGEQTVPEAQVRAMSKTSSNGHVYTGYVTFLHLRPSNVGRIVKKDKVRGTRAYKSRKDYPFFQCFDTCELEKTEANDCTVRALSRFLGESYEDTHAYLKRMGRQDSKGFVASLAYKHKGLWFVLNQTQLCFGALVKSGLLPHRAIVQVKGHVVAVLNGTAYDTFRMGSNKPVRGWYTNGK